MTPSLEYLAGYFDGEGWICMFKAIRCCTYKLTVGITSAHRPMLVLFQERFGGYISAKRRSSNKPLFQWGLDGRDKCLLFLQAI
jgi:hypothetical protein